ncbi:hypothetical protein ACJ5NV_15305 [Loktanella agnita]|uniref:hypothetical protein n=1 Tax=Loktanella agnita TaxID=287097 RepID=UPI0039889B20
MMRAAAQGGPTAPSEMDLALFGGAPDTAERRARAALCPRLLALFEARMTHLGIATPDTAFLTELALPLMRYLTPRIEDRARPFVIGLAGGPGAGKTTLSALLADLLPASVAPTPRCLSLSIDDFYYSAEVRAHRGLPWRTLPGSHDTDRIAQVLSEIDRSAAPLHIPRYDLGSDAPLPDEVLEQPPDICVFDGAMIGSRLPGYDVLARRLDMLVYLDVPLPLLKEWRFAREARLRASSQGRLGYEPAKMQAFWDEALAPSVIHHVRVNMVDADLVIELREGRRLVGARLQGQSGPEPGIERAHPI